MIEQLTKRQREFLALTAQGMKQAEVAATCYVSEFTVKRTLDDARERIGAQTLAHAVALAIATEQLTLHFSGNVTPAKTQRQLLKEMEEQQSIAA